MQTVKTAISLDASLLDASTALANELHISRSRLVALAMEEFIIRHQNRKLLEQIDAAQADAPTSSEIAQQNAMRTWHHHALKGEW